MQDPATGRSPFPPIGDYGFLSDCETVALVAPSGNVEWLCLPRLDSPSVFGAMLDRDAGGFRFGPDDLNVPGGPPLPPGHDGPRDELGHAERLDHRPRPPPMGPWHHEDRALAGRTAGRRPTTTPTTCSCAPSAASTARCRSPWTASRCSTTAAARPSGSTAARPTSRPSPASPGIDLELTLTTDLRIGFEGGRATARTLLKEGEHRFCALSWSEHAPPTTSDEAYERLVWTAHHWQHWLARGHFPDHPWRGYLQRSALTLKGLTFAPTGALVAAATTSLPETPGGERNWDYRYSWVRDATFALWALYTLGFDWEANDFFWFIADVAERDEDLQVMYGVDGERELPEQELDHLEGYEGARPVRVGNAAYQQRQHDVWGAVLDSVYLHTKTRDGLDERIWPILVHQVESALAYWREPDQGIWEVRGEPQHFTSSKLMCWVAVDRGARLASLKGEDELAEHVGGAAPRRSRTTSAPTASTSAACSPSATARRRSMPRSCSCPCSASCPPTTRGCVATVRAIADELTVDGLVLRYRVEETDDGLGTEEGAFLICSFWLVSALVGDRRPGAGEGAVREAAVAGQPARALRRGDRPPQRPPPRQLPAGLHPPRADQRRDAHHPVGPGRRRRRPSSACAADARTPFMSALATAECRICGPERPSWSGQAEAVDGRKKRPTTGSSQNDSARAMARPVPKASSRASSTT